MARIEYIFFLEQAKRHLEFIARMKADLQEYSNRNDAKQSYIDKRNAEIATFYIFYENALSTIESLQANYDSQYSRGKSDGYRQKEIEIENIPRNFFDKEAARAYSIDKAIKEQPHLF